MSKYGVFSGPYFLVFGLNTEIYSIISIFSPNTGKYGPEKTPYLDTFHAVLLSNIQIVLCISLAEIKSIVKEKLLVFDSFCH